MSDANTKPENKERLMITFGDQPRECFMSFGLLNECLQIVVDLPNVAMMGIKPEMRNQVLSAVLSKRDDKGIVTEEYNPFVSSISAADAIAIVQWVAGHTLSFFLSAMESNLKVHAQHKGVLGSMASGLGSQG